MFAAYLPAEYDYTHEQEFFDSIVKELKKEFEGKDEYVYLIGNFVCNGKEFDAVIFKKNAIIVLEFKKYSGNIVATEIGDWTCNGNTVYGGNYGNPYHQVKKNKFALLRYLKDYTDFERREGQLTPNKLGHISGIVVFDECGSVDINKISEDSRKWFHITDRKGLIAKVRQIKSDIHLTESQIKKFIEQNRISPYGENRQANEANAPVPEIEIQKEIPNTQNDKAIIAKVEENSIITCLKNQLAEFGFRTVYSITKNGQEPETISAETLGLHENALRFLKVFNGSIYRHQYEGIKLYKNKKNVCMATSTGSGKSEVFFLSAIDLLSRDPNATVLAVYPMKALNRQQERRWKNALECAGMSIRTGRIEGGFSTEERERTLKECRVVLITPDTLHSWLLARLEQRVVNSFLNRVKMVVIDEVHTYTGVFGSNSAYLFRRLNYAIFALSKEMPQYLTASATIENPEEHLTHLTGLDFEIIDKSIETHRTYPIDIIIADAPDDPVARLSKLVRHLAEKRICDNEYRTITFIDSRQVAKLCAQIANRANINIDVPIETESIEQNAGYPIDLDVVKQDLAKVEAFVAGLNPEDAEAIQSGLENGTVRSVISTSALEIGLDIGDLDLCILYGIPSSATSFYQRIGRVGRKKRGAVIIINDNSFQSENYFKHPERILSAPYSEPKLYLDNENIQFINALCFADQDNEYESLHPDADKFDVKAVSFPQNFLSLAEKVFTGQIPRNLNHLKQQVDDGRKAHLVYPLRDLESLYTVVKRQSRQEVQLGQLSRRYQFREAYPGAIYYYCGRPYRVKAINHQRREIYVVNGKRHITKPIYLPVLIIPNLSESAYSFAIYDKLKVFEAEDNITESISGYEEIIGSKRERIVYAEHPNDYRGKYHSYHLYSSGVHIMHPSLNLVSVSHLDFLSALIYEAFLSIFPLERQDIGFGYGQIRSSNQELELREKEKFLCIYDQTYGSLRLTSPLMRESVLPKVIEKAIEFLDTKRAEKIIKEQIQEEVVKEKVFQCLKEIRECLNKERQEIYSSERVVEIPEGEIEVIRPFYGRGKTSNWLCSTGIHPVKQLHFYVERIDWTNLKYIGYYEDSVQFDDSGMIITHNNGVNIEPVSVSVQNVDPIGGVSLTAFYNPRYDTLRDRDGKQF